ncbi:VOC family protein [Marinobacter sp. ATCH36]|uniref:VOC family protein n=1 Tax=Marinobacter sp. ATCH36 TaxID=2945106 RepID=UPI002022527A|nr:VOC family protein [Marinobacter sp. ATCH36]MCL7942362.1 VOC family protein [Marinobacter sp. ATCH36]
MPRIKQRIVPHLWYDTEAREAAQLYASLLPESEVTNITTLRNTPSGDCDVVSMKLWRQPVMAISAGPFFRINPSISLMVNFDPARFGTSSPTQAAREALDHAWDQLSRDATVLMPLDEYPFSKRYGWVQDRYGLSWQLILTDPGGEPRPPIIPAMLFVGENCGRAEEAILFYLSVFRNSQQGQLHRYEAGPGPDREGTVMFADFMLENTWFAAMDSAHAHDFAFNEALSFRVNCDSQEEIDYYWERLSAVPEAEQCGWIKDRFGVSWQIVPAELDDMMSHGSQAQVDRVTQAFLKMKKFDLAAVRAAYDGE